jgi:hypothetical protein
MDEKKNNNRALLYLGGAILIVIIGFVVLQTNFVGKAVNAIPLGQSGTTVLPISPVAIESSCTIGLPDHPTCTCTGNSCGGTADGLSVTCTGDTTTTTCTWLNSGRCLCTTSKISTTN